MKRKQKHRLASLLLCFMLVFTLIPMTASAATTTVNKITITMPEPVFGQPLPTTASTPETANTYVTGMAFPSVTSGIAETYNRVHIDVEIKPGADAKFTKKSISASINGVSKGIVVSRKSDTKVTLSYTFQLKDPTADARQDASTAAAIQAMGFTNVASYDTFDYRAYANVYPDLKAAYGYDSQKLFAHYVNYGMAEGRVGTFIDAANNPKTDAPIYGNVPGTTSSEMISSNNIPAIVPATLLDPMPPSDLSKMTAWTTDQMTAYNWMSNAKLVAEYYSVNSYMTPDRPGYLRVEAPEMRMIIIHDTLSERARIAETVYCYENNVMTSSGRTVSESEYNRALKAPAYKKVMESDPTILRHWLQPFPTPPADPGVAGDLNATAYIDDFDPVFYYNAYPDLQAVITPDNAAALYQHYIVYGKAEGRACHQ